MSLKKKHIVVLVVLFILALFVAQGSNPKNTVIAQNRGNLQIHDVPFDISSAQVIESVDVQIMRIPDPRHLEEYVLSDALEQALGVQGDLDKFVFLPVISNNYVYVFDDFSDPNSGFPIIDTSTNTYQYINGEYQILNKTSSYLGAVTLGNKLEEFEFEVSMRRVGSAKGYYGLVYWLDDTWDNYNIFMISPETGDTFHLNYKAGTGFTLLSMSTTIFGTNLGNGVNRVNLKQYREWEWEAGTPIAGLLRTEFSINGSHAPSLSTPVPEGVFRVGFFAAPIDPNHQVHFDNYLFKNYCFNSPGCNN